MPSLLACEPTALLPPPSYPFYSPGARGDTQRRAHNVAKPFPDTRDARLDIGKAILSAADAYGAARAALLKALPKGPGVDDQNSGPSTCSHPNTNFETANQVVQEAVKLLRAADRAGEEAVAISAYWCDVEKGGHSPWAHPVAEELVQHLSIPARVAGRGNQENLTDSGRCLYTHEGSRGRTGAPLGPDEPDPWGCRCEWLVDASRDEGRDDGTGRKLGVPLRRGHVETPEPNTLESDRPDANADRQPDRRRLNLPRIYREAMRKSRQVYCLMAAQRDSAWETYALAPASRSEGLTVHDGQRGAC